MVAQSIECSEAEKTLMQQGASIMGGKTNSSSLMIVPVIQGSLEVGSLRKI